MTTPRTVRMPDNHGHDEAEGSDTGTHLLHPLQIPPPALLAPPRERALRKMTNIAFKTATATLNLTLAKNHSKKRPPDEGNLFYWAAIENLINDVLVPLMQDVWVAVKSCLDDDNKKLQPADYKTLWEYGWQWSTSVGHWIGARLLGQLRHFTTPEQHKAGENVIRDDIDGLIGSAHLYVHGTSRNRDRPGRAW